MKKTYVLLLLFISSFGFAQEFPGQPTSLGSGATPDWTRPMSKMAVDTCGAYFNNYVGLVKTTDIYFEEMRTGNAGDFNPYAGRGQRFHANQDIEISGIQFYAFQNNMDVDSIMVVTLLFDYDEAIDSVGAELARDTVWVSHPEFTPLLPDLEVDSYFDEPVVVSEDYIIAMYTSTDDSLKIITNSAVDGDGDMEGVSFAYYENPVAPSFTGWYPTLPTFGPSYDIDYLMNPLVRYKMHDNFVMDNDTICPNEVSAVCVDYPQVANFSDPHYNRFWDDPAGKVEWNWGDGLQNTDLLSLCHTYNESGTFTITLTDSIRRHDFDDFTCAIEVTQTIFVRDSAVANATATSAGLTADFDGSPTLADSVAWDFGDGSDWSTEEDPSHMYDAVGEYDVWFYAYGPCNTDSIRITVTISDVSITENELDVAIYPNPANDQVFIKGLSAGTTVEVVNIIGEVVYVQQTTGGTFSIRTTGFAQGAYFIRLKNESGETTRKLIVKH